MRSHRALLRRARASQTLSNYRSALADLEAVEALLPAALAAGKGSEVNAKDLKREVSFCQAQAAKLAEIMKNMPVGRTKRIADGTSRIAVKLLGKKTARTVAGSGLEIEFLRARGSSSLMSTRSSGGRFCVLPAHSET